MTTVTILLPTLNRGYIIGKSIESIRNQTDKNWRMVIVDNGSTDNTSSVCLTKAKEDERITYHRFDTTVPVYENWERALDYVDDGYFVCFSDDDIMSRHCVAEIRNAIEQYDSDVILINRATYSPVGDSLIPSKIIGQKTYTRNREVKSSHSLLVSYITAESIKGEIDLVFHPSMLFINIKLARKIKNIYKSFYKPVSHDYFAGVMLGLYSENMVFIDSPLVVIGGYSKQPYCFCSNKFDYFQMSFDEAIGAISLNERHFVRLLDICKKTKGFPYFKINIIKQTLLTIYDILKSDESKYQAASGVIKDNEKLIIHSLISSLKADYNYCITIGDKRNVEVETLFDGASNPRKTIKEIAFNSARVVVIKFLRMMPNILDGALLSFFNILPTSRRWGYVKPGCYEEIEPTLEKMYFSKRGK